MNTEKKYRFNAIDAIIILAVIAVIAFCAYKMLTVLKNDPTTPDTTYRVKIEMKIMREGFSNEFKEGDVIYDRTMNTSYGKIVSVSAKPSTKESVSSVDGEVKLVTIPEKEDITFIVDISSDEVIAVGQHISFKNDRAVANGYALEVTKLGGEN